MLGVGVGQAPVNVCDLPGPQRHGHTSGIVHCPGAGWYQVVSVTSGSNPLGSCCGQLASLSEEVTVGGGQVSTMFSVVIVAIAKWSYCWERHYHGHGCQGGCDDEG